MQWFCLLSYSFVIFSFFLYSFRSKLLHRFNCPINFFLQFFLILSVLFFIKFHFLSSFSLSFIILSFSWVLTQIKVFHGPHDRNNSLTDNSSQLFIRSIHSLRMKLSLKSQSAPYLKLQTVNGITTLKKFY